MRFRKNIYLNLSLNQNEDEDILRIPKHVSATFFTRLFGLTKIPLVYYVRPKVIEISDQKVVVKIPFKRRNRNHVKSMYFGAMAIGAELAAGLIAMKLIVDGKYNISMVFKQFSGNFLKRAESDTFFVCKDGDKIGKLVSRALKSPERVEETIYVYATVPDNLADEVVAEFSMTISLKGK